MSTVPGRREWADSVMLSCHDIELPAPCSNTDELLEDLRSGRMVILMDDEDRENEGDLIMAADHVRAEDINFMAHYGRGLICLTLTRERCRQLNLRLMTGPATSRNGTNFTVSIGAARGVTKGISAADRATTIRTAITPGAKPADLVQPGHVFPLMAQPGGVLARAGHTEAGCDLARLAGLTPAAVIVEIMNEDGTMARRPDLEVFADRHGLKLGTIADLIHYRLQTEMTVRRVAETPIDTEFGRFRMHVYEDTVGGDLHLALVRGNIRPDQPVPVRVHVSNPVADLTAATSGMSTWPLRDALRYIGAAPAGVAVILRNQIADDEILHQLQDLARRDNRTLTFPGVRPHARDMKEIGLGAQILSDLGVRRMRVLSTPRKFGALSGFGLEAVEYVGH